MDDETHVRLVDTHAESAGGDHDIDPVSQEVIERGGTV
jgi:hypothetical protein